ncbi:MAG: lecithin retinol acyltransferase family protein [Candidatus Cloacimonetes bacterium]|nr:lecithin retinol acyltransferase family protein [Candidatus Cloacimonadota bacterium]
MKYGKLKQELNRIKDSEFWIEKNPEPGDHIRRRGGIFNHHALYISDGEVIHFTYGKNGIMGKEGFLELTSLEDFKGKRKVEVRVYSEEEQKCLFPVEIRIKNALAAIGRKQYDVLFSNCEHYISFFTMGKFESRQINILVDKPIVKSKETGINNLLNNIYIEMTKIKE